MVFPFESWFLSSFFPLAFGIFLATDAIGNAHGCFDPDFSVKLLCDNTCCRKCYINKLSLDSPAPGPRTAIAETVYSFPEAIPVPAP